MDALGATVGMAHFASQIVRKSYAVYDDTAMNADIERAVERLKKMVSHLLLHFQRLRS